MLQNSRVTALNVFELLRENQLVEGRGGIVSNEFVNLQPNNINMVKFVDVSSQVTLNTLSP